MDASLLAIRLLLVAILAVAGVAKLVDPAGSRKAVTDFGLPGALAAPLAILLPLAELVAAGLLLPATTAWWGTLLALALLVGFAAGIALNLARGRKPDCHCFGQLHSEPVGWRTLARNGALMALAVFVTWQGPAGAGPSALAWLGDLPAWQAVLLAVAVATAAVIAGQTWFLLQLFRQHGRLLLRLDALEATLAGGDLPAPHEVAPPQGLPVGAPAPAFDLPDLAGARATLDGLRAAGRPVLLVFSDPGCGPCTALAPDLARWRAQYQSALTLVAVGRGTAEQNRAKVAADTADLPVLLQDDREVATAYQAHGTPAAVMIRPDGTVGSALAMGADAIRHLVARTAGAPVPLPARYPATGAAAPQPVALPVGAPAPALELPDLDGEMVRLEDFRGRQVALLFWNPGCGFCSRMLPDLRRWEADPPPGAPELLVVSGGTVEANRAMGLRSRVVLDPGFAIGHAFGAGGTPSAVLVGGDGKVEAGLGVGASAVLALLGAAAAPLQASLAS